ncbi:MAG TPA: T9SS type A sorting domain-containing protein [Flavisolibacter sp.]|nr:T9SS type A sorting domain-containing protein [Flavisolibacter sp.]
MKKTLLLVLTCILIYGLSIAQPRDLQMASNTFSDSTEVAAAPVKKNVIKLYPNPSYGKLSVSASTTSTLHFYIFDLEGTLVYQAVLKNKDKKNIENLAKGTYIYDVFEKDESIEEGKIIIK